MLVDLIVGFLLTTGGIFWIVMIYILFVIIEIEKLIVEI